VTEARDGSAQSAEPAGVLAFWRALGRTTTPDEQAFLDAGGFAG
jgi:uncharacterized protein (DUF924 family)